jgi:hypothetical protein
MAAAAAADGRVEDRERRVALAASLDEPSSAGRDDLFDDLVVSGERHRHRVGVRLPRRSRALDVGQQEGHGAYHHRELL